MYIKQLIKFMSIAEKLKNNTRHSWTSDGRQESVAEHSYGIFSKRRVSRCRYK